MTLIFYLILILISESVTFSWVWFIVAIVFVAGEAGTIYKYRYTNDPDLVDEEFEEQCLKS